VKIPTFDGRPKVGAAYQAKPAHRPLDDPGRIERHRFYNRAAWKRCRLAKLAKDPLCERCRIRGLAVAAQHVHHRIDLKDEWSLRYDLANLESLCQPCHSAETIRRQRHEPQT
jgi:5-methylcytosine-specific restriction endonuclease McrA